MIGVTREERDREAGMVDRRHAGFNGQPRPQSSRRNSGAPVAIFDRRQRRWCAVVGAAANRSSPRSTTAGFGRASRAELAGG